ncbi:flagellar protein FliT [Lysinibacillus yapensis]|uniref:Flagellar protein FliT n=1 Tax=Ureibacillus yapensis TaxID=2304605 RepID=A0A396SEH8_9BACL|nr:flagellar protein FliT [Lysinibacillus yapensis]RHW39926.1 flagellar protein FliT [Lysinibacillus yapensis]
MEPIQELLEISEKLLTHLTIIPTDKDNERDAFIQKMNELLNARGAIIDQLKDLKPNPIHSHPLKSELIQLDQGIREQLQKAKMTIADDLKQLQITKKSEQRYINPYAAVQVMDGTYYDKKK